MTNHTILRDKLGKINNGPARITLLGSATKPRNITRPGPRKIRHVLEDGAGAGAGAGIAPCKVTGDEVDTGAVDSKSAFGPL